MSDDDVQELELNAALGADLTRRTVASLIAQLEADRSAHPKTPGEEPIALALTGSR